MRMSGKFLIPNYFADLVARLAQLHTHTHTHTHTTGIYDTTMLKRMHLPYKMPTATLYTL